MFYSKYKLLMFGLGLVTAVCHPLSAAEAPISAFPAQRTPGHLHLPLDGSVSTLDPGLVQFTDAIELSEQLFLGLTDFDPETYTPVPELAERWERNEEGTVFTFYLRRDARWSNGEPVTAHDVVWAIRRNLEPDLQAPYAHTLFILKNAEPFNKGELADAAQIGVKALDDYSVEFTLETPASYFPALSSLWIYRPLPRAAIERYGKDWTAPEYIQSNGSYRIKTWDKDKVLVLEKNPHYYAADTVGIQEVHYFIVPRSSVGLRMYKNDELDVLGEGYLRVLVKEVPEIRTDPELSRELYTVPSFCTEIYVFNTRQPPLDNVWARKALNAAVNKRALIDFVIRGKQEAATTFTRPPIFGAVSAEENAGIAFNPKQARAWLAQAGYPDGKGVPPLRLAINQSETHEEIAKRMQKFFDVYLDIELEIHVMDFDAYADVLFDPDSQGLHLFRLGWCADYPDANNWLLEGFHPQKSPNFANWDNARFAELTERAQTETDPEIRRDLYRQAEIILNREEAVILPLYFATTTFLVKPWVQNWYSMGFGGQHVRNWRLR